MNQATIGPAELCTKMWGRSSRWGEQWQVNSYIRHSTDNENDGDGDDYDGDHNNDDGDDDDYDGVHNNDDGDDDDYDGDEDKNDDDLEFPFTKMNTSTRIVDKMSNEYS